MEVPNRAKYIKEIKEQWYSNYVKCDVNINFYKLVMTKYENQIAEEEDAEKKKVLEDKLQNVKDVLEAEEQQMKSTQEYLEFIK